MKTPPALRRSTVSLGRLVAIAALGATACSSGASSRGADEVIDQFYGAVGGYSALKAIHTRRMVGTYEEGRFKATTDIAWSRPALRRVNVHAPGFEYSEGHDTSTWEYDHLKKHFVRDTGAAAAAGRRGAEFDESFVDYRAKGHRVELVGRTAIVGRDADELRVTLADGWVKEYYFDTKTHLILALRKAMPIHATGPAVETLSFYEDWRAVGGVQQAHRFVERSAKDARILNTLEWDRIEVNVPLTSEELGPPR